MLRWAGALVAQLLLLCSTAGLAREPHQRVAIIGAQRSLKQHRSTAVAAQHRVRLQQRTAIQHPATRSDSSAADCCSGAQELVWEEACLQPSCVSSWSQGSMWLSTCECCAAHRCMVSKHAPRAPAACRFESSDRVGGRTQPFHWHNQTIEMGASIIWMQNEYMRRAPQRCKHECCMPLCLTKAWCHAGTGRTSWACSASQ